MLDTDTKVLTSLLIGTLVATGIVGIASYLLYSLEIAIIAIFTALLVFTVLHIFLFYLWLRKGSGDSE